MAYLNAHCHLELSALKGAIPPGLPFVEWLDRIRKYKLNVPPEDFRTAALAAWQRVKETETTVFLDILSMDITSDLLAGEDGTLRFFEMISFDDDCAQSVVDGVAARAGTGSWGYSPHAPFTTTAPLLRYAAKTAQEQGRWLCIHAAETAEETAMMLYGNGAMRDFLAPILPKDWKAPGLRPIAYLDSCGCLTEKTLLVHLNDLSENDLRLIKKRGCSVVVCPGTHVYFDRGEFPLKRLMEAGIPCFLGTDSLASNEDLDMAREVELAAQLTPGYTVDQLTLLTDPRRAERFF